ncbi:phosphoglycerate dehydrogenase [Staphylococcus pseudintermedius]|uniref:phosphoglycerate dehydrogenase n=1 Tax=Staphylococcus pseudintermedius TaxID=283734 RepID=UPI00286E56A5|nr:phosphoglycerate dehydrogenase [Staphylococcus pseudintermedius]WMZ77539.1 phosphoglycerate dehydrogenase [Staphylococcus pseudintermedius]WMZ82891.1 phosphoglycerate dehydrogenase [Staphylococcus pseudintermedius]WMZ88745.1 phosphoglycerate dehydrogenase [Staphylococcus pseudintermedius]
MLVVSLMRLDDQETRLQEAFPHVDFKFYKHPSQLPEEVHQQMDVLISYHPEVDAAFIENAPNLKWIAWYATGVNRLPFETLKKREIQLTNARGVHAQQLTEFLFAYILDDYKELKSIYEEQQARIYNHKRVTPSVKGQHILFLGTGKIPQRASQIAKILGMKTIGLNTTGHAAEYFDETYPISERHHIYKEVDIVVNLLPETTDTRYLLTVEDFKAMNQHTLFVNLGRGTIAQESVIVDALKNKSIRKAYLDVFEQEPLESDSELYQLDNVFLTPHISGSHVDNKKLATDIFSNNLKSFLSNGNLIENKVNIDRGY